MGLYAEGSPVSLTGLGMRTTLALFQKGGMDPLRSVSPYHLTEVIRVGPENAGHHLGRNRIETRGLSGPNPGGCLPYQSLVDGVNNVVTTHGRPSS